MKVGIAQLNPTVGAFEHNFNKIMEAWATAEKQGAELVITSEAVLTGYPMQDLALNAAFCLENMRYFRRLVDESRNKESGIIVGFLDHKILAMYDDLEDSETYNAAALIYKGSYDIVHKHELPNYGVFDEKRYFKQGNLPRVVNFKGTRIALMICEDMWHKDVPLHLVKQNPDMFVVINGSPFEEGKLSKRMDLAAGIFSVNEVVNERKVPFIYVNQVGGQDEIVFDGSSFLFNGQGHLELESFRESVEVVDTEEQDVVNLNCDEGPNVIKEALVLGLRDYFYKNGFKKAILGISGGIDSAVVAAIACDALGPENVKGYALTSKYNSRESVDLAFELCSNLGMEIEELHIDDMFKQLQNELPDNYDYSGVPLENAQSRIRGMLMMTISNATGAMLLSTGNKSEVSTGYATLYGDMSGGFNPLKDVYKTQVYHMSTMVYADVIPQRIITRPASAELAEGQLDQDKLPPYDVLDFLLESFIEGDLIPEDIKGHNDWKHKVYKMLKIAEYKRRQSCPGVKITDKHHGMDRRWPITNKWLD